MEIDWDLTSLLFLLVGAIITLLGSLLVYFNIKPKNKRK